MILPMCEDIRNRDGHTVDGRTVDAARFNFCTVECSAEMFAHFRSREIQHNEKTFHKHLLSIGEHCIYLLFSSNYV